MIVPPLGWPAYAAGEALGDYPAAAVRSLVDNVLQQLEGKGDPLIETIAGGMLLSCYLPTRTFELAVHSQDIADATGVMFVQPDAVLTDALGLANRIAIARGDSKQDAHAETVERLQIVLDVITQPTTLSNFAADLGGIELRADDVDWSFGSGTPVFGAAQDLALVLCGRKLPIRRHGVS
jgi:hypothetical protein